MLGPPAQVGLVLMEQCLDGDPVHLVLLGLDVPRTVRSRRRGHIRADHGSTTDPRPHPIGAVPGPDVLTDAGVSAREAEVLTLVGAHLTNVEIAGRLFISVRTVESHVSSLLRKLGVADRRALAGLASTLTASEPAVLPAPAIPVLPSPLTSFVGRASEQAALAQTLNGHRFVTAVGPGGVGKTRLALAVAAAVAERYADGAWYVDLVPVTDPEMVGAAVAAAFGFGEQLGRSPAETVVAKLAGAEVLLVLDNCEHLIAGVAGFVERLLSACPRVTVLATSRVRLLVPFESVFPVPGLSLDGDGAGDAVALFVERAAMAGWVSSYPSDRRRIATICAELDGVALAIELAAARLATFGLDGIEAGLGDQLELLAGGPRLDDRHRSVRSALDWSYGLLDGVEQVVLRRASVFAAPFTPDQATAVVAFEPIVAADVARALGRLADHSLLVVTGDAAGTRYRMLETIRQYGGGLIEQTSEDADVRSRHLRWCVRVAAELAVAGDTEPAFGYVVDDLRAALGWASLRPEHRADAYELAHRLAHLAYERGLASESQRRFEEAAAMAADYTHAASALRRAAAVAWARAAGNEAVSLYRAAAQAAEIAGDGRLAAVALANAAELINRSPGLMSVLPEVGEEQVLLDRARALAGDDPYVEATALMIMALDAGMDPTAHVPAERAVALAAGLGDARLESAALDQLTSIHLARGDMDAATRTVRRRIDVISPLAGEVEMAWERSDALHMGAMTHLAAGDMAGARRLAVARWELPFFRQSEHLGVLWLIATDALAGDFDEAAEMAGRFRRSWIEAGRPTTGGIGMGPAAAAMAFGIRGDEAARTEWLGIVAEMRRFVVTLVGPRTGYGELFDGLVALHHGDLPAASARLADVPDSFVRWYDGAWRQWYAAAWAEVAVLAGLPERDARIAACGGDRRREPRRRRHRAPGRRTRVRRRRSAPHRRRRPRRGRLPLPTGPNPCLRRRRRPPGGGGHPRLHRRRPDGDLTAVRLRAPAARGAPGDRDRRGRRWRPRGRSTR